MEEKNVKELLEDEIRAQLEELSHLDSGSQEKSDAVDDIVKLYRLKIDESKAEWDADEKYDRRLMDAKQKELDDIQKTNQLAEQKIDRKFKLAAEMIGIILPLICYGHWIHKGFKFEEKGAITSFSFKEILKSCAKPTRPKK